MKNSLAVCGEKEHREEYLCEIVDGEAHGHVPLPNPLVRVLRVLRYPRQRAIMQPEIVHEVPPIESGTVCRLEIIRAAEADDLRFSSYDQSFSFALSEALNAAQTQREREVLLRHRSGKFSRRRILVHT